MVEKPWVVNASPLIALAKIGHLDLLLAPSRILMIPEAVVEEVRVGPPEDPARVHYSVDSEARRFRSIHPQK